MPTTHQIVTDILRTLGPQDLTQHNILIIGGTTAEPIDNIRTLTTRSSGITTNTLATNAHERNAQVTLWYGNSTQPPPEHINTTRFTTYDQLSELIHKTDLSQYTTIIVCAAIADYKPHQYNGKIPSGQKSLTITLSPTPKLLQTIKTKAPKTKLIGYKLEPTIKTLQEKTKTLQKTYNLHLAIGNTSETLGKPTNTILIIDKTGKEYQYTGKKDQLANVILDSIKE